jgi:hypothetical protein
MHLLHIPNLLTGVKIAQPEQGSGKPRRWEIAEFSCAGGSAWFPTGEQEIVPGGSFVYMMCFSVVISAIIDGRTPAGT